MIDRYSMPEMKSIWDLESKFSYYLQVELAVCDAYNKLGKISDSDLAEIKKNAKFEIQRIDEIEAEVKHDVIAFLTCVNENLPDGLSKYMHMGLTSSDVIDTALSLQIQDSGRIILEDFENLLSSVKKLAFEHKDTVCIGRSHGVHAELTTFGTKVLTWYDAIERVKNNFERALEQINIGQISGPVGTYSNVSPEVEKLACEKLGLKPAKISTQIIARDYHAAVLQSLALIATVIEQFATEIRHLQRTEVRELEEGFGKNQKGSSAMPHKKNPVLCENLCGLARVVRANSQAALENIVLWHERDISHSSAERIIFPDSFTLVDFMLKRFDNVVENLIIYPQNMLKNAHLYGEIVYSQAVLLKLTELGYSREDAYRIVQKHALDTLDNNGNFKENILNDDKLKAHRDELLKCFDAKKYLENINTVFDRFCENRVQV